MTATLLDSNVLVALLVADHVHHDAAEDWLAASAGQFATCPITEGALVRLMVREGRAAAEAQSLVRALHGIERHEFWPEALSYPEVRLAGVIGHRQVTDAYLAELARARGGRLATFDRGLAVLHADVADLIPSGGR